jgi:hypothetical protein
MSPFYLLMKAGPKLHKLSAHHRNSPKTHLQPIEPAYTGRLLSHLAESILRRNQEELMKRYIWLVAVAVAIGFFLNS